MVTLSKRAYLRASGGALDGGPPLVDDYAVGEVGCHDEVVLDDEGGLLGVHDVALDHLRGGRKTDGL